MSAGPPTDVSSLKFKEIQTYSDSTVVRWMEESTAGRPGPSHVLTLAAAGDTPDQAGTGTYVVELGHRLELSHPWPIGIVVGVIGIANLREKHRMPMSRDIRHSPPEAMDLGRLTQKTAPPSGWLVATRWPPWAATMSWAIESPSPEPGRLRAFDAR